MDDYDFIVEYNNDFAAYRNCLKDTDTDLTNKRKFVFNFEEMEGLYKADGGRCFFFCK